MTKKLKKADYIIIAVLAVLILLVVIIGMFSGKSGDKKASSGTNAGNSGTASTKEVDYTDYQDKKIGIITGTSFEAPTLEFFPNAQHLYYNSYSDISAALKAGKIDGFLGDEPALRMMVKEQPEISYLPKKLVNDNYAFGFTKNNAKTEKIRDQFNEMLKEFYADGTMEELGKIWFGDDESKKVVDFSGLTGERLNVVTSGTDVPFSYYKDNKNVGLAMDLVVRFCHRYGYEPYIEDVDFAVRIPGLVSNKYDMCASSLTITPERQESIDFSDVIYEGGISLAVRSSDLGAQQGGSAENDNSYKKYDGKIVGILTGSSTEPITFEKFPNSKYEYYDSDSDLTLALKQKKIDAFVTDEPVARMIEIEQSDLTYLKKVLVDDDYHVGFQKDTESSKVYIAQFNEMLAELKSTGQLDKLIDKWFEGSESEKVIDTSGLDGKNGELKVAARSNKPPFSYFENSVFKGYAVELVTMFARRYGYTLKFEDTNLTSLLAGLSSKKYDIGISCLSITEERKKSIDFSDTFYEGGMTLVIRNEDLKNNGSSDSDAETVKTGFFESIKDSFVKNFVREDRWKLIVQGIGTTCLITLLTVIFGSILAFLICMLRRVDSVLAGGICNLYVKLLQGTPMVVLLMILYYVIFGKSGIDAIWVAVIGFSLNFGAYGSEIMRSGIESIDKGQREAALALGFTENQGFFKFIFPQAAVRFLPVYRGEIISLLKNTSIVGYIAIQDLTKMSDIIRSRTFEAFFPLISTAVIYFILAWIITFAMSKILKVVDPKNKKRA